MSLWCEVCSKDSRLFSLLFCAQVLAISPGSPVCTFIFEHPIIVPIFEEIYSKLCGVFGKDLMSIKLEIFSDPEATIAENQLFILAQTRLDAKVAIEKLDRFENEWWLDNMHRANNLISVDVEFI